MITPHTLDELGPDDRVAVLVRAGDFHFRSTGWRTAPPMSDLAPSGTGPRLWPRTCGTRGRSWTWWPSGSGTRAGWKADEWAAEVNPARPRVIPPALLVGIRCPHDPLRM